MESLESLESLEFETRKAEKHVNQLLGIGKKLELQIKNHQKRIKVIEDKIWDIYECIDNLVIHLRL